MRKDSIACATAIAAVLVWAAALLAGAPRPQAAAMLRGSPPKAADPAISRRAGLSGGIVFTRIPQAAAGGLRPSAAGMVRAPYGDGGQIVLLGEDGSTRVLTGDFESASDPSVSFDGKRVLFAGRKSAAGRWNIYEMNADGSGV
jgi:hypothetical protein